METLAEAQAALVTIKAAINEYYNGTRRRSLKVGGREFNRSIEYADIALSDLITERNRLEEIIAAYSPPKQVVFKGNTNFPLFVTRKPTN